MTYRLFPEAQHRGNKLTEMQIEKFANEMIFGISGRSSMPAGLTYLGQMISHDIVPSTNGGNTVLGGTPTPNLDLFSVYGNADFAKRAMQNGKFILGFSANGIEGTDLFRVPAAQDPDQKGFALIPEKRNDENYLVSQMHLLWQKFHNAVVDTYFAHLDVKKRLIAAKSFVIDVFHQIVVDEFLWYLLDKPIFQLYCVDNERFLTTDSPLGEIPVEFSHGVFRFGHSMVRKRYPLRMKPKKHTAELSDLLVKEHGKPMASKFLVEWELFFEDHMRNIEQAGNHIDMFIVDPMADLDTFSLERNIVKLNLAADGAQSVATANEVLAWIRQNCKALARKANLNTPSTYTTAEYPADLNHLNSIKHPEELPIWLYVLLEKNRLNQKGARLGTIGSIIVAEVLMRSMDFANLAFKSGYQNRQLRSDISRSLEIFYGRCYGQRLLMRDVIDFVKRCEH